MTQKIATGLADVIAGETAISHVGAKEEGLTYRGYEITALVEKKSYEEVAYCLLHDDLPNQEQLQAFKKALLTARDLPDALKKTLELIPKNAHPMDVLRTGCSFLGTIEPENDENQALDVAIRLLACFPSILMYWYHFHYNDRRIQLESNTDTIAGYFLDLLYQKTPDELSRKTLDTSLILYAEHEFNASTFAARVTAATLSDFYSAICSAIGTLRGPLHGGANEQVLTLLLAFDSVISAEQGIQEMLAAKKRIMGFGHRIYKKAGDPRHPITKALARKLADRVEKNALFDVAEQIEQTVWQEKHLYPNLDFYTALVYYFCEIPKFMFTPIFALARTAGWAAHIFEQRQNNKLIRPLASYIGSDVRNVNA